MTKIRFRLPASEWPKNIDNAFDDKQRNACMSDVENIVMSSKPFSILPCSTDRDIKDSAMNGELDGLL